MSSISGYVNVRIPAYSATGDGITDDGKAIQQALSDVGATGGCVVFLLTGNYIIKTRLSVSQNTSFAGIFIAYSAFGNPPYSKYNGTQLFSLWRVKATVEGFRSSHRPDPSSLLTTLGCSTQQTKR